MKLKIGRYTPNSCPPTWHAIVGPSNCLMVFHNLFQCPFQSLFKLPKISLKFMLTPALSGREHLFKSHFVVENQDLSRLMH